MVRNFIFAIVVLLTSVGVHAQYATLHGMIKDKATGEPIPFASVVIYDVDKQLKGCTSSFEGTYHLESIPFGTWTLEVRAVGYEPLKLIHKFQKSHDTISLDLNVYRDPELVVVSDLFLRDTDFLLKDIVQLIQTKTDSVIMDGTVMEVKYYSIPPIRSDTFDLGPAITAEDIEKMPGRSFLFTKNFREAKEYHVSVDGDDHNEGTLSTPFKTIGQAGRMVRPGDVITVHEGIYRERIDPRTGGSSDQMRVVYQAAMGEKAVIKGSEVIDSWVRAGNGIWKVVIPNDFFGEYNPYRDVIGTDWYDDRGWDHHTGEVYLNDKSLYEVPTLDEVKNPKGSPASLDPEGSLYVWYCTVDDDNTTIYANFHDANPNQELVEINVREACFYPSQPGINYITVRGFYMSQAACQWSTAADEQNALLGTHWSKGWIIEDNVITHRAFEESGWSQKNVGSHIVRNNTIYDCEKNGIHGSLGAIFSIIEHNHIYNIHTKRQYGGPDLGGIKILGAIDVVIRNNRIHNTHRGIWMDWMAQGTRITSNLLYDNDSEDLFMEVNHGPFVIDNNLFLSENSIRDWSQGGAFLHNLFAGIITHRTVSSRKTPYLKPHSTEVVGIEEVYGGDQRFFNNIFIDTGLDVYDDAKLPMHVFGNLYLGHSKPYKYEHTYVQDGRFDPKLRIEERDDHLFLEFSMDSVITGIHCPAVTSAQLGRALIPDLPFTNLLGNSQRLDGDYYGNKREDNDVVPGPFRSLNAGSLTFTVW